MTSSCMTSAVCHPLGLSKISCSASCLLGNNFLVSHKLQTYSALTSRMSAPTRKRASETGETDVTCDPGSSAYRLLLEAPQPIAPFNLGRVKCSLNVSTLHKSCTCRTCLENKWFEEPFALDYWVMPGTLHQCLTSWRNSKWTWHVDAEAGRGAQIDKQNLPPAFSIEMDKTQLTLKSCQMCVSFQGPLPAIVTNAPAESEHDSKTWRRLFPTKLNRKLLDLPILI